MTVSDWVISTLTGVLVLATVYYAWQTRQTVKQTQEVVREMQRARELQVMPKMVPAIRILGPDDLYPRVMNMGAGSAVDVKVKMTLEPNGPSAEYAAPVMTPERSAGNILRGSSGRITKVNEYEPFPTLRMEGTCSDVLGHTFSFNEVFDLKGYIEGFKSGMWARLPGITKSGEPLKLIADAVVNIENLMRMERESD